MKKYSSLRLMSIFLSASLLTGIPAATVFAASAAPVEASLTSTAQENKSDTELYLNEYFHIPAVTAGDADGFNNDLKVILGSTDAPQVEGALTWKSVLPVLAKAADFNEFALTYPSSKIDARLARYGISKISDADFGRYLAADLDAGLITQEQGKSAANGKALTKEDVESVLTTIVNATGQGRNYLGKASDADIYEKLDDAWNSFQLYNDQELTEIGAQLVKDKTITGFNLKDRNYDARFLSDRTLTYSHDNIAHARQLIALLRSENIDAKVALEPKVSSYEYLLDWGPVPDPTPTYEVRKLSDNLYVVFSIEYDLQLEFDNDAQMKAFNGVVLTYAKKTSSNSDAKGMIKGSWWQPCYNTTNTTMDPAYYTKIVDMNITDGQYTLKSFVTEDNAAKVQQAATKLIKSDSIRINPVERSVNNAFYNYLTGTDYE